MALKIVEVAEVSAETNNTGSFVYDFVKGKVDKVVVSANGNRPYLVTTDLFEDKKVRIHVWGVASGSLRPVQNGRVIVTIVGYLG